MANTNDQTETAPGTVETNRLAEIETEPPQYRELDVGEPLLPLHLKLNPPVEYDGEKFSELHFDFEKLIGKDFQRAEREFTHRYKPEKNEIVIPEMKQLYRAILAAHTADVPLGVIDRLPGRLYIQLLNDVLKLYGGSPEPEKA
jgi:hypothetical protein